MSTESMESVISRTELLEWADRLNCKRIIDKVNELVERGKLHVALAILQMADALLREASKYDVVDKVQCSLNEGRVRQSRATITRAREMHLRIRQQVENRIDRMPEKDRLEAVRLKNEWQSAKSVEERTRAMQALDRILTR